MKATSETPGPNIMLPKSMNAAQPRVVEDGSTCASPWHIVSGGLKSSRWMYWW